MAARRDPEMARRVRESLDLRGDKLAELVTEAQATGAIDPSLDTEAVVRFCHALGFGFLLFRAIELDLPDPEPWEQLISRLVDALDVANRRPPTADTDHHRPRGNPEMTTNEEMLGRADVNDLEAILAITTKDVDEMVHAVKDNADAHLHVELREGRAPGAQQALREGQGRPVERRDRPPVAPRRRHREGRRQRAARPRRGPGPPRRPAAGPAARTTGARRSGTSSSSSRRTGR